MCNLFCDHVTLHMRDRFGPVQQRSAKLILLDLSAVVTMATSERDTFIIDMNSLGYARQTSLD